MVIFPNILLLQTDVANGSLASLAQLGLQSYLKALHIYSQMHAIGFRQKHSSTKTGLCSELVRQPPPALPLPKVAETGSNGPFFAHVDPKSALIHDLSRTSVPLSCIKDYTIEDQN